MFVVEVIPLAPGFPPGTLSYRSANELPVGALIRVPLRKKETLGLVVSVLPVREAKASLKTAGFALRAGKLSVEGALSPDIVNAAEAVAREYATTAGGVLGAFFPAALPEKLPSAYKRGSGFETRPIEASYEARVAAYRNVIRKNTENECATLLIAPTMIEAKRLADRLRDHAPVVVTGILRGKRRSSALSLACQARGLVIATPAFSWMPIERLGALVLERPSAGAYLFQKRPYLSAVRSATLLAEARQVPIVYGDLPLPFDLRPDPAQAIAETISSPVTILDTRKKEDESEFRAIPDDMLRAIRSAVEHGGRAAVLAVRKGYAPAIVCRDCGTLVRDERGRALALSIAGSRRILRSADGETKLSADAVCAVCGSWNLIGLGIGLERVEEELKKALPQADIVRLDLQSAGTGAGAAIERAETPGTVIVGTEAMLPFLDPARPVEIAAIASADSLLALPFWRARERLVRVGLTLRERSKKLLIATRAPEELAFSAIAHPERSEYFSEETELRRALSYPPFGTLLVFHAEGTKPALDAAARAIEMACAPRTLLRLADRIVRKNRLRLSLMLKLSDTEWPDPALSDRLIRLPMGIEKRLDPESLW